MEESDNGRSGRLRLHITPTAEWKLRSGHPWLFSDSILSQNRDGKTGELAVVYDRHDNFLAIGLFDASSPIRARIVHRGKPEPIDAGFWRARLREALHVRANLFDAQTNGYRIIHGENDRWPGLVLDRYDTTLVLKLYTPAWLPRLSEVTDLIADELGPERIILRLSRNMQDMAASTGHSNGSLLAGPPLESPITFLESGLRFEADVLRGQKTGFFLDQRENRRAVESLAAGRTVLNLFSFTGAFSLYAARGGALSVTNADISAPALEGARRNFAFNANLPAVARCRHETIQADAFKWLRQSGSAAVSSRFDLVIIDPPSLAKRESEREGALEVYGLLAESAINRMRAGGVLAASSCSAHVAAPEFFSAVTAACGRSGRSFKQLQTTEHPPDHPATFPEAHYLKTIFIAL